MQSATCSSSLLFLSLFLHYVAKVYDVVRTIEEKSQQQNDGPNRQDFHTCARWKAPNHEKTKEMLEKSSWNKKEGLSLLLCPNTQTI